jgi:2-isopropylmalate synthase
VVSGTFGPQSAELELSVDGERRLGGARGDGPVDAIFNAVKVLFPHEARLAIFEVHAVTEETDAQAGVTVRLAEGGKSATGRGADTDTMVAAAKAYVHALNKLLLKRLKSAPEALTAARR